MVMYVDIEKMFQIGVLTVFLPLLLVKSKPLDSFEIQTVIEFANEIVNTEMEFLDSSADEETAILDTLERMKETSQKIENFIRTLSPPEFFYLLLDTIRPGLGKSDAFIEIMHNLDYYLNKIESFYKSYLQLLNKKIDINEEKFEKWINKSISNSEIALPRMLHKMYLTIIHPDPDKSDINFFRQAIMNFRHIPLRYECGFKLSIQGRLLNFCQKFILNQIKGFIMKVYANTINAIKTKSKDKSVFEKAEAEVVSSIAEYMLAAKSAMKGISRKVETCDAKVKTTETYASFEGFLQSVIVNQADTNPDGQCRYPCSYIKNAKLQNCSVLGNYCPKRSCYGRLDECSLIEDVELCELPPENTNRYVWYQDFTGKYFGTKTSCHKLDGPGVRQSAKSFISRDGQKCNVCSCICFSETKQSHAIRAVSFRPQISAIQDNMVIAGIRINAADRIIQIQIKQGKLINNGRIDPSTVAWKETEKMRYDDTKEADGSFDIYKEDSQSWEPMTKNIDYTLFNAINRNMYVDTIILDSDYVITGARWNYASDKSRMTVQMEVYATKFDVETGKLDAKESMWISPQNMSNRLSQYNGKRKWIPTTSLSNPTASSNNIQVSQPNQWFRFEVTNLESDVSQSTVPYFDTQAVETDPPMASSGIEIILRSSPGFGGFIAPRLLAIDLSSVWKIQLNDDDVSKYHIQV